MTVNGGVTAVSLASADGKLTKTIKLQALSNPSAPVTVAITVDKASICSIDKASIVLEKENTDKKQFVLTTAMAGICTLSFTSTSTDSGYNGLTISNLVITVMSFPLPPTDVLVVSTGLTQVLKIDWTAPINTGNTPVTGYQIQQSTDSGSTWTDMVPNTGNTATAHTQTGLVNDQSYSIRVATINTVGTSSTYSTVVSAKPCTAGLVFVPTAVGGSELAGSLGTAKVVGKLHLTCPIQQSGATVTVAVTTATADVCSVGSDHVTLTMPSHPGGVDVYISDTSASTLKTNGGECQLSFDPSSTTDTGAFSYNALATPSAVKVLDVRQASVVLSTTTLTLTSGCDAGTADTSITVTTCNGQTSCTGANGPTTLTLALTSSDVSVCTVPAELVVAKASVPIGVPITAQGPGTCTVTMATTATGTATNLPYETKFVGTYPSVAVTVTGGRALDVPIADWEVLYATCGDHIKFDVTAKTEKNKWIALGVSTSAGMGDSDVMICSPGVGGSTGVKRHWLEGYTTQVGRTVPAATGKTSCSSTGTATTMSFRRPLLGASSQEISISNGKELSVLWAAGNSDTVVLSVAHRKRGSVKNTFVVVDAVVKFTVEHSIKVTGVSAQGFNGDPKLKKSFQSAVATLLAVDAADVTDIVAAAAAGRRQRQLGSVNRRRLVDSCAVTYKVKVASKEKQEALVQVMVAEFKKEGVFTTELKKEMAANSVTTVKADAITTDTTAVPATPTDPPPAAACSSISTNGARVCGANKVYDASKAAKKCASAPCATVDRVTCCKEKPAADDGADAIEKELRVAGLDKFVTLDPAKKLGMTWTLTATTVEIAIKAKGLHNGWISLAFPAKDTPAVMNKADAVSGDASSVNAWKLNARDVENAKGNDYLIKSSVEVVGEYITFQFTLNTDGTTRRRRHLLAGDDVPISGADVSTPLLWSFGKGTFQKGKTHTKRGATLLNFKTGGTSESNVITQLTTQQQIISLLIVLVLVLIPVVGGVAMQCKSKQGLNSSTHTLTQTFCNLGLVRLRCGELSVWLIYAVGMIVFIAYRVALVPTLFEVQRSFGWVACWTGFIAAFPALQSECLLVIFGIPFERSIKHHRMMGKWFWIFQTIHFVLAIVAFDLPALLANNIYVFGFSGNYKWWQQQKLVQKVVKVVAFC